MTWTKLPALDGRKNPFGGTYYLVDPDFRRNPPPDKPFCAMCQKTITNLRTAVAVTVDWDTWRVVEGGDEYIGPDCWKRIVTVASSPLTSAQARD